MMSNQFWTKAGLGEECKCGVPSDVIKEHGYKRFRLPAGYYGGLYREARYYSVWWWSLRCQKCHHERDTMYITTWGSNGDFWPIMGAFATDRDIAAAKDIRDAIYALLPDE